MPSRAIQYKQPVFFIGIEIKNIQQITQGLRLLSAVVRLTPDFQIGVHIYFQENIAELIDHNNAPFLALKNKMITTNSPELLCRKLVNRHRF